MKKLLALALVLLPLAGLAQDDLYFTPSKKAKKVKTLPAQSLEARVKPVEAPVVADYHSNTRSDDEYNRRGLYDGSYAEDTVAAIDGEMEGGRGVYDMDDPELDYRFSRRIVRFHSPRLYALASPYYWDLHYTLGAWDYLYDPYDPWYWHYGWGYGWTWGPWDCWYGGIYGWHRPYDWAYWGWGPCWSRPVWHVNYFRNTVPRSHTSTRGHMAAGNRIRTSALGERGSASINGRTSARSGMNVAGQGVRNGRGNSSSYTDYANGRTGRGSSTSTSRPQVYNPTRENANRRSTLNNGGSSQQRPVRSYNNQNSSSRSSADRSGASTTTRPRTSSGEQNTPVQSRTTRESRPSTTQAPTSTQSRTSTYSSPSRSSSSGSFGGGGFSGGGRSSGGSVGGGGRSGGGRR